MNKAKVCVCVCVCVFFLNANLLHFTCFGFRTMQVDGISVIYFRFMHLLGRPRNVSDVYLYCIQKAHEVRMTVCVIVL